jgi:ATP-binding cassette, subfamily B, bacterial CvaB/MchF/RaxB
MNSRLTRGRATCSRKRVPVILQSEASECGIACLAMIIESYAGRCDLSSLREAFATSSRGLPLRRLIDIARHAGLIARPLRIELEYVPQLQLPCILHWGLFHYVVLVETKRGAYVVHDPALGRRIVGEREFSQLFTGVAVELDPSGTLWTPGAGKQISWGAFLRKARGAYIELGAILSLALLLELLQLIGPFYLQWTVDWAIGPDQPQARVLLVLIFIAVLLAQSSTGFIRSLALLRLGVRVHLAWLTHVFGHTLRLPVSFFERRYVSDLMGRFEGISYIQRSMTSGFLEMLLDGLMSVGLLGIMYAFNTRLAAASTLAIGCAIFIRLSLLERLRESVRALESFHARQQGYFLETVRSIHSIKLFCAEGIRLAQWANLAARCQNRHVAAERTHALFRVTNLLVFGAERLFAIWYATSLVTGHSMSLGMLFSYMTYRELLAGRVMNLLDKYVDAKAGEIHLDRLADIALAAPEAEGTGRSLPAGSEPPQIQFTDVWFRYADDEPWILKGASACLAPNAATAITGSSGCGKSTLLRILQGLLKPTKGSVTVYGTPIEDAPQSYRRLSASVNQGEDLLMGTLAENIAFFDMPLDFERVQMAARQACIDADILSLPMRYNTLISDARARMSGGQIQRILLARALYKQPQVLFLDEATSHLDTQTEQSILHVVRQLPITRIVVAHRAETIAACDHVLSLADGLLHPLSPKAGIS